MWDVMELHDDTFPHGPISTPEDPDLRDDRPTGASQRWWFRAILVLDLIAVALFVAMVVVPRLT
jgi:hypothetical protein